MNSTPVPTDKTASDYLLPLDPWPEVTDYPMSGDYPIIEEDTVEIDLPRF